MFLANGMNDFLTKPIDKVMLFKLLEKWIPAGKIRSAPAKMSANAAADAVAKSAAADQAGDDTAVDFWKAIEQIKGLSVETGLERIYGQRDVYRKTLQLTIKEITKCDSNLNEFLAAGDMQNFRIEVHGIKGSLANVGVMELSARAYELEKASANEDAAFCAANDNTSSITGVLRFASNKNNLPARLRQDSAPCQILYANLLRCAGLRQQFSFPAVHSSLHG
jgi:HPt (histidine-containing phosphotransfer) domain-containing protein